MLQLHHTDNCEQLMDMKLRNERAINLWNGLDICDVYVNSSIGKVPWFYSMQSL